MAIRWYELYDPAGTVTLNQQGTFAPDSTYRWMASMAEDQSAEYRPGIQRVQQQHQSRHSLYRPCAQRSSRHHGDGSQPTRRHWIADQRSAARWGDYTAMQVDPSDDCTFWYVDQYEKVSGTFNWNTNIGSFVFNGCGSGGSPDFYLTANPKQRNRSFRAAAARAPST